MLQPETLHRINALTDVSAVECAAVYFGQSGTVLTPRDVQKSRPAVHQKLMALQPGPVFVKTHNANLALHDVPVFVMPHIATLVLLVLPLFSPVLTAAAFFVVRYPRDLAISYFAYTG